MIYGDLVYKQKRQPVPSKYGGRDEQKFPPKKTSIDNQEVFAKMFCITYYQGNAKQGNNMIVSNTC